MRKGIKCCRQRTVGASVGHKKTINKLRDIKIVMAMQMKFQLGMKIPLNIIK